MTKQKSIKGLFIYLLIGIIAIFSLYLYTLSTLSTNPTQLEQMREMMGISVSPEMRASLYTPFYSTDFDLFRSLNQVYLAFCEVRVPCGRDMPPLPSDSK